VAFIGHAQEQHFKTANAFAYGLDFFFSKIDETTTEANIASHSLDPVSDDLLQAVEMDYSKLVGLNSNWLYTNNDEANIVRDHDSLKAKNAKVIFVAGCKIRPSFATNNEVPPILQMFDINDSSQGRALIYANSAGGWHCWIRTLTRGSSDKRH